jgi:hypothetical protein
MAAVRWIWVLLLGPSTALCLLAAPATGLLTLPLGMVTGGLLTWLLQGGPKESPTSLATWLVGSGLVTLGVAAVVLVLA